MLNLVEELNKLPVSSELEPSFSAMKMGKAKLVFAFATNLNQVYTY